MGLDSGLGRTASGPLALRSNSGSFSNFSAYSGQGMGSDWSGVSVGPAFVFVVDGCSTEEDLGALKSELLHIIARLPENALVGLVVFDAMVRVYDLGFADCLRAVVFHGGRDVSSEKVRYVQRYGIC